MAITNQQLNFEKRIKQMDTPAGRARSRRIVGMPIEPDHIRSASLATQMYMVPFAMIVGAVCWLLARAILFHLTATGGFLSTGTALALAGLLGDISIAIILALILSKIFNLGHRMRLLAQLAGFVVAMTLESNLIAQFPVFFAQVYSDAYVAEIIHSLSAAL